MSGSSRKLKFKNHPFLKPYVLEGLSKTHRTLGTGSFGVMEELTSRGTYYAGKKLHDFILDSQDKNSLETIGCFVQVCKLLSDIRHPNIVQFIGLHFDENVSYPILVMEQLDTDLDSFLKNPGSKIPFSLKLNILYDIVKGLLCLHERKPPVVHRDLTAHNILLCKSSMRAKITDYGNTLIFNPHKVSSVLRQIPEVMVYMPPEAMTVASRPEYDASFDIFSFGQIMLYTALQEFPDKLLPATYLDPETNELKPRNEVERRGKYFGKFSQKQQQVYFTLAQIIERCFRNEPSKRPTASEVMISMEDLKSEHEDLYSTYNEASKMELVELLETIKKDTRRRSFQGPAVEDEEKLKLDEKAMQARIEQLKGGMPGVMEILRKSGWKKPMKWQQCLFRINSRKLQYSEPNSNKILSKAKLVDVDDIKTVEMTSKLEDHMKYYFEIHFSPAKSTPTWQLRVHSAEEREAWMEAIKPDSTVTNDLTRYKQSILATLNQFTGTVDRNLLTGYEPVDVPGPESLTQPKHSQDQTELFGQGAQGQTTDSEPEDQLLVAENRSSDGSDICEDYVEMASTTNEDDKDSLQSFEHSEQHNSQPWNSFPRQRPHAAYENLVPLSLLASQDSSLREKKPSAHHKDALSVVPTHTRRTPTAEYMTLPPIRQHCSKSISPLMDPPYKIRAPTEDRPIQRSLQGRSGKKPQPLSPSTSSSDLTTHSKAETNTQLPSLSTYENLEYLQSKLKAASTQTKRRKKPVVAKRSFKTDDSSKPHVHVQPALQRKAPVPAPRQYGIPKVALRDLTQQQQTGGHAESELPDTQTDRREVTDTDPYGHFMPLKESLASLQKQTLFISPSSIEIQEKIGQGQYGNVHKGVLHRGSGNSVPVAIKSVKRYESEKDVSDFQREMNRMLLMIHPNIIRVYGLVQQDPLPWIVMEYLPHGSLKNFLIANKRPVEVLVKYMLDIAVGMHYVSEKGLVHRDLAARNVIVGSNEICKVSDFGLLRELPKNNDIYVSSSTNHLPIRWMAPESLCDRHFSTATDVWSYAVLLWEMSQPDKLPYVELVDSFQCCIKIIDGYRLEKPETYPRIVKDIMDGCWLKDPLKRPSFYTISSLLTNAFYGSSS